MIEGEIYKIKGQDYYVKDKLVNTKVRLDKLFRFGSNSHSVTYLNKDDSINKTLKDCPLTNDRFLNK